MKFIRTCAITFLTVFTTTVVAIAQNGQPIVDQPLPPDRAASAMKVPPGFNVTLFAGEPDVMQPIAFCVDDRARIWVAEAYNYPNHGTEAGDRIIILEDTDGDGEHDRRKVFFDGLNYVTGIEVGFGGVWVMSPPYMFFIADRDGDDTPDSEPQVLLDGFGNHANAHNLANGFAWGPDGWLYGTHGRTNWSMIGKPGTPDDKRVRFDGGVYRYHPIRHVWEPYADGTTNPWGIDWNDYGHSFVCNCVNPHLFQVIQGAHYEPWRGRESSQYAYQRIDTIADHLHFTGLGNIRSGIGSTQEDEAGGGHAHCGTMIYLGDSLPPEYRGSLFTNNIHGRRINNDILKPKGSGYVASHGDDLLRSGDPWFMGVTLTYGPQGEIYASDWSDTGECHSTRNTRRHTGRIYRITYGKQTRQSVSMAELSTDELVELQLHENDWFVRHARRLLQERSATGEDMRGAASRLVQILKNESDVPKRLRALWALKVTGNLPDALLLSLLNDGNEHLRSWAITLACEPMQVPSQLHASLTELASTDPSPLVRLSLASALGRLSPAQRWPIGEALVTHAEDTKDQNIPLITWYGIEPLISDNLPRFIQLANTSAIPRIRINLSRRVASSDSSEEGLELLTQLLGSSNTAAPVARDILDGILQGLEGQRNVDLPATWPTAYVRLADLDDEIVQESTIRLALIFNDKNAMQRLREIANDETEVPQTRTRAIEALASNRASGFDAVLIDLLDDSDVRSTVLSGLAQFDHPKTATAILRQYAAMDNSDKQIALHTLASRASWSALLLDSVADGNIAPSEITAYTARQIRSLNNAALTSQLAGLWGEVRESPRDRVKQIESIKRWLDTDQIDRADLATGKLLYTKHCASCHTLFGDGGKIGPDITGSQRHNIDYMLENIVDPSASVAKDYKMEVVQTVDGRVITGLVESQSEKTLTIQTAKERIVIPVQDIDARKTSSESMMPSGLLSPLTEQEIRDLFGYLQRTH